MNQNNRKKKGLSKRVLALLLCGFCLLATSPVSALALETEETQITEESISQQQSESTGEALLSLSSETSESQTQQSTSGETIEPMNEKETDAEITTEVTSETAIEVGTETETTPETGTQIDTENDSEIGTDIGIETGMEVGAGTEKNTVTAAVFELGTGTDTVNPVCTCTPVNGVHADTCELYEDPEVDTSAVDALFAKLMAFESYEELDTYMSEEMTEEEYVLMDSFTEEQNAALMERVEYLSQYDAEILGTVTAEEVLETFRHIASGNKYQTSRVYLAVRRDGNIPGEPSVQGSAPYNFYNSSYSTNSMQFGTTPSGIIDENIVHYQNFIFTSVDGTDTAGLVDGTGVTTNQVLSGIDFDALLNAIASAGRNNRVTATDGQVVTASNKGNYKVVCYVIKLQLDENYGWHIDCAVVPKTDVTLSYNINIPDGYEIQTSGVGVPNSKTGLPPATFTVGAMNGLTTIEGEQNAIKVVNASDSTETYVFMFQGWNTKADGSGTWYQPGTNITISEDTVLYAIWNSNPAMGTGNLEIQKIVKAEAVSGDALFTFRVTINEADGSESTDTYNYVIYDSNTIAQSRGTISSGGTISLKHTQYVEIRDLPAVNAEGGQPNVTIQEINHEGYDASWDGGTTVSDTTSVTIQGGRDSRVTCTNTVSAPKVCDLTITKTVGGNMGEQNKEFAFTATLPGDGYTFDGVTYSINGGEAQSAGTGTTCNFTLKHGQSITFARLPIGATFTVEETSYTGSGYVTTVNGETGRSKTITLAETNNDIAFVNRKDVTVDTGISLETLPYILILGAVVAGAVLLIRKRRNRYDDETGGV